MVRQCPETQNPPIQMLLTLGSVWFKCNAASRGMGCKGVQFWDVKEPKKHSLRQLCLSTFMNLANWRPSHWDHCLPLWQVHGVGLLSLQCLRIGCLAAGGCLDFHDNLWSYPCSQEPAHPTQPATVWWITLRLCLPLSADDRESPGGWHLCVQKLKLDEVDPTHIAHTWLIALSKDFGCI